MPAKRTDGNAVDVVANATLEKDTPVFLQGFHGFVQDRCVSGDKVALDISGAVWEFAVPSGLTAPKGAVLYISTDGNHTIDDAEGAGLVPFCVVVEPKDSNNIVWAKHLPQGQPVGA